MLSPDQIEKYGNIAESLLDPVTEFLIADITQRVAKAGQITGTAAYQVWRLQNLGYSQEEIKKQIAKRMKISEKKLEKLIEESAKLGYRFDLAHLPSADAIPFKDNEIIQGIVSAAVQMGGEELENITRTIGFVLQDGTVSPLTEAYHKASDYAWTQVATGSKDYNTAVRNATRQLVNQGIQSIDYESGQHCSVEAAVRRNVISTLGTMQADISQQNHDDFGADGWEISAHAASAPDHEPIQGKQYTDEEYQLLNDSLQRQIGTLNCGHSAFPIIIGVSQPIYTPSELEEMRQKNEEGVNIEGRHFTSYEATQKQRQIERAIRKQKRRVIVEENIPGSDRLDDEKSKLNILLDRYSDFSKAAGLPTQWARVYTTVKGYKY